MQPHLLKKGVRIRGVKGPVRGLFDVRRVMDIGWAGTTPSYEAPDRQPPFEIKHPPRYDPGRSRAVVTIQSPHGGRQLQEWIFCADGEHQNFVLVGRTPKEV